MRRLTFALLLLAVGGPASADDSERLLTIDHYVRVKSTVPALAGQDVPIYVRERVQAGTSLRAEDEVARGELLFAVLVSEDGAPAQHEEHLLGSEVHVHPHPGRTGGQFVERCSHPGVVRPPEDPVPGPVFFVVSVPLVGEQVLTSHLMYLPVVAVLPAQILRCPPPRRRARRGAMQHRARAVPGRAPIPGRAG